MIKIEVSEGKAPWVIGIAAILAGIGLAFVPSAYQDESAFVMFAAYTTVFLIICSGIWLCIKAANRKLTVEDGNISYSNWYGRKTTFSLDEIGYCKAALEGNGNNVYLKLYNLLGEKLCKLEFDMKGSMLFLQYLLDNRVKIECSEKSDPYLKYMVGTEYICPEEIPGKAEHIYEEARNILSAWLKKNSKFGAEWKTGIALYAEDEKEEKLIALECYLQKEGQFVMDRRNQAVSCYVPIVRVAKSLQIGEPIAVRFFVSALDDLTEQLSILENLLPVNRYHTGELSLDHELYTKPPFGIDVSDMTWKSVDNDI